MSRGASGQLTLLSIIIISGMVIGIGMGLWGLVSSISDILRTDAASKVSDNIMVLRSHISADYVYYPPGEVMLRNTGKWNIVVFRLVVYNNGTLVWDSGIRNHATIPVGETANLRFNCPGCEPGDPILITVHYIPEPLFNPDDPRLLKPTPDVLIYKVASFKAERAVFGGRAGCPVPENWLMIDFMDPLEDENSWTRNRLTPNVKIRVPDSSNETEVRIRMRVEELMGGDVGVGEKDIITGLPGDWVIHLDENWLQYPLRITINPVTEGWTILQREWVLGIEGGVIRPDARPSYIKLLWNRSNKYLVEAFVKMLFTKSGRYVLTITIYDCNGDVASIGRTTVDIDLGRDAAMWSEHSILLQPSVSIFDAYRIELEVVRVG